MLYFFLNKAQVCAAPWNLKSLIALLGMTKSWLGASWYPGVRDGIDKLLYLYNMNRSAPCGAGANLEGKSP
ncbi:hypothetical protein, partial [Chromobacterium haemolyticum]|uniref:hypothetical protein n=1 Tax=Chromobacterium haemolyticum TaxID=394935 RepID=UPI001EE66974